ncbi:MAG: hypothetical protein WBA23_05960 [Tunicatimonas sp.]|uniref:hypothetical protein n=1 Tax=Tunicatimonas sp. TaxID=1940096 RepID=UPI003C76E48F
MEVFKTKQKLIDRTLTIELPEEFKGTEVNITVEKKAEKLNEQAKQEKLAVIQRFAGIYQPGDYILPEDEWYKQ